METATSTTAPSKPMTNREKVVAYIRRKGVSGKLTEAFIRDIDWTVRGMGLAKALEFTTCYPEGAEGAQAFIDELLALDVKSARAAPPGSRVVTLANWMEHFRQEILAGEGED